MDASRDRAALVTGGTTGLGAAIARAFLREGASVAFTGRDRGARAGFHASAVRRH